MDSEGQWIRATLQVRDEANEAFLVTICKSLLLILQRQQAAEGLGRGTVPPKKRSRKQKMLPWREGGRSLLGLCCRKSPAPGGMDLDACTCGDQELAVITGWEDNGLEGRLMNFIVG